MTTPKPTSPPQEDLAKRCANLACGNPPDGKDGYCKACTWAKLGR